MEKKQIKSLEEKELIEEIKEMGEKSFHGAQIYEWIHKKLAADFDEMTNLSKVCREKLKERYDLSLVKIVEKKTSIYDETTKFLFQLLDGNIIESVLMKYQHGNSVCISSQVGCRMGCHFCASTLGGLERNLTTGEMLDQIYQIQKITGERVSNVVVMGAGEPFDNFENLLKFIFMLSNEKGLYISQRNITVSTCGIVEKIRELMQYKLQITLAVSLHASNDEIRKKFMPIANQYTIKQIIEVCKEYYEQTKRRITFEYSLIQGVNDSTEQAQELSRLLKGFSCHVNLIPVNPIKERNFQHSSKKFIQNFKFILEKNRINVTIRREMGSDVNAACGQLRRSYINKKEKGEGEKP